MVKLYRIVAVVLCFSGGLLSSMDLNQAERQELLFDVVEEGNAAVLASLVTSVDVNAVDESGLTPLMVAVYSSTRRKKTAEQLREELSEMNAEYCLDMSGDVQLNALAPSCEDNKQKIEDIIQSRMRDAGDFLGTIQLLLAHGANINAQSKYGRTALMMAAEYADPSILTVLLKEKPKLELRDLSGKTALMLAIEDPAIIDSDSDDEEESGLSLFRVKQQKERAFDFKKQKRVQLLLEAGANIFAQDNEGHDITYYAMVMQNDPQIYKTFLEYYIAQQKAE